MWYSAILYGGKPEEIIKISINTYRIVISDFIIDELKSKLKREARAPYKCLNFLELHLKRICDVVEVLEIPSIARDPKDDPVIAAALRANCGYLIAGDKDLLAIKQLGELVILTPKQFIDLLD